MQLTETEKRILVNIHLAGKIGKCGSLTKQQRVNILNRLISNGYLTERCNLTKKGIDSARQA